MIKLSDSRIIRRHHDHVRIRSSEQVSQDNIPDDNMILPVTVPVNTLVPISIVPSQPTIENCVPNIVPPGILHISQRIIHVPDRLNL